MTHQTKEKSLARDFFLVIFAGTVVSAFLAKIGVESLYKETKRRTNKLESSALYRLNRSSKVYKDLNKQVSRYNYRKHLDELVPLYSTTLMKKGTLCVYLGKEATKHNDTLKHKVKILTNDGVFILGTSMDDDFFSKTTPEEILDKVVM